MRVLKLLIIIIVLIACTASAIFYIQRRYDNSSLEVGSGPCVACLPPINVHPSSPTDQPSTPSHSTSTTASDTLLLKVPFTPQAPTGNWDVIHNEDCEEASAIMANAYYYGPAVAKLDPSSVESQLTKLTDWELTNFGYNLDITSVETVRMIEDNFKLHAKVETNVTEQEIKNQLAQNHLVLIPVNGQLIDNPNYKQPGPKYHMLLIRGYSDAAVGAPTPSGASEHIPLLITNDPGTRNGLNYAYSFDTLYNANGVFDHTTNSVNRGQKNIIVVSK